MNKGLQPLVPEAVRLYDVLGECVKEIPPTPLLQRGKNEGGCFGAGGRCVFCEDWGLDGELCGCKVEIVNEQWVATPCSRGCEVI